LRRGAVGRLHVAVEHRELRPGADEPAVAAVLDPLPRVADHVEAADPRRALRTGPDRAGLLLAADEVHAGLPLLVAPRVLRVAVADRGAAPLLEGRDALAGGARGV